MAHNENSLLFRLRARRAQAAMTAPEPEWIEGLRDVGLMLSGIYQDLRGDARESYTHFRRWMKGGLRKLTASREQ